MTGHMVDSITPTDIPVNDPTTGRPWDYVLGYVDGAFGPAGTPPSAWTPAAWSRFPGSRHVRCAVLSSTLDADVLDRETGDATAAQAVQWVQQKRARGDQEPTVYVGLADWGALQAAFVSAGVPHPHYGVAAYPGAGPVQQTLNGITSAFHQYADPITSGGHFDLSVVADGWLNPLTTMEDDVSTQRIPLRTAGNWLVWCGVDSIEDTQLQLPASATWQGIPIGTLTADREAQLRSLQAVREEQLLNPTPPVLGSVNLTLPPAWTVTDVGGGVTHVRVDPAP